MARGEEKRRREALHLERLREEREAGDGPKLPMSEDELAELVDHLDEWLATNECDRTLREFGGGCDCEVVANMDWADE